MANTLYLENCLDSLEALPAELKRNFTLMHDLDNKNRTLLQEIDGASDDYLRKARGNLLFCFVFIPILYNFMSHFKPYFCHILATFQCF